MLTNFKQQLLFKEEQERRGYKILRIWNPSNKRYLKYRHRYPRFNSFEHKRCDPNREESNENERYDLLGSNRKQLFSRTNDSTKPNQSKYFDFKADYFWIVWHVPALDTDNSRNHRW